MNNEEALYELASRSQRAAVGQLDGLLGPGSAEPGRIAIIPDGVDPLAGFRVPAVAVTAAHADGASGAHVIVLPISVARRVLGQSLSDAESDIALTEDDLLTLATTLGQTLRAAAAASGRALDQRIEVADPTAHLLQSARDIEAFIDRGQYATVADVRISGTDCRVVQLVPPATVLKVARALARVSATSVEGEPLVEVLGDIPVRVWAELGRTRMSIAQLVSLDPGEIVALDRELHDPIDIYVDGMLFATARLDAGEHFIEVVIETLAQRAAA